VDNKVAIITSLVQEELAKRELSGNILNSLTYNNKWYRGSLGITLSQASLRYLVYSEDVIISNIWRHGNATKFEYLYPFTKSAWRKMFATDLDNYMTIIKWINNVSETTKN
jgi:hypothetical protein